MNNIIAALKDAGTVPMEQIETLRSEAGRSIARFRPQEVVASYSSSSPVVHGLYFERAEPLGWELLSSLMTSELSQLFVNLFLWLRSLCDAECQSEPAR